MNKGRTSFVILIAVIGLLVVYPVMAQNKCVKIEGIGQAQVGPWAWFDTNPDNWYWGGPTIFVLNGQEVLTGFFAGQDGTDRWHGQNDAMGQGKGGSYTFVFSFNEDGTLKDSFTTTVTNAVFPNPPGKFGFGFYQASHKIISGTGHFKNASGNIVVSGTYGFFMLPDGTIASGWNPNISGTVCNVE